MLGYIIHSNLLFVMYIHIHILTVFLAIIDMHSKLERDIPALRVLPRGTSMLMDW